MLACREKGFDMHVLLRQLLSIVALLCASNATASAPATWPASPSLLELDTTYGIVSIDTSEYVYESRLLINGYEVDPTIRGRLNISYAFNLPTSGAALVSIDTGNDVCPISYRWVILDQAGYTLSPAFGSCSGQILVSATRTQFTLKTPSPQKPDKIDVYTYDGKTIKHTVASLKP